MAVLEQAAEFRYPCDGGFCNTCFGRLLHGLRFPEADDADLLFVTHISQ